jgi:hypothetical protein
MANDKPSSFVRTGLAFLLALLIPSLVWGGTILVQQVRLRSAIRACEAELIPSDKPGEAPRLPPDRVLVIRASGCRAVPSILDAAEETKNADFTRGCRVLLMTVVNKAGRLDSQGLRDLELCGAAYNLAKPEDLERRARGLTDGRTWWRAHAAEEHPWWKFWSWKCLAD